MERRRRRAPSLSRTGGGEVTLSSIELSVSLVVAGRSDPREELAHAQGEHAAAMVLKQHCNGSLRSGKTPVAFRRPWWGAFWNPG
jgi:hypothetical protein